MHIFQFIFFASCFLLLSYLDLLMHRRSRLEKLFYRLFAKTRTTPGGPFFAPRDSLGRNMIPLYVTVLKALSAADTTHMTHFYRRNRVPSAMDDWVEQQHMLHSPGRGSLRAPSQQQQQPSPTLRLPAAALNFAYQNSAPPAVLIAKNSPTGGSLASAGRVSTAGAAAPASVPHSPAPPPPTGSFKASDLYVEDL